jgi:nitrate reductase molybdenum cofactor assembly chaperone NarJ/NarW
MVATLKVLSALLTYPSEELKRAVPELRGTVADEGIVTSDARHALNLLLDEIAVGDIYELQERYVFLFDRTRSLSLHLFEHVHGESRDRGQAMIDLKTQYEANGMFVSATELPDFLPLFLEYLSTRPLAEAAEMLGQAAHILSALAERLGKRGSAYEAVFRALLAIAAARPRDEDIAELLKEADPDPDDFVALDAAWEDEPVTFGPVASSCKDGLVARLRAARRPASTARQD